MSNDSKALATTQPVTQMAVAPEQMDLIKRTVAKGATDDELKLYLYDCARRNVHPLDRLIVFTARSDNGERKYTPVVTVDFLRSRAADTEEYAGNDDPAFEYLEGAKNPQSSTVTVWKIVQGQRCAFTATARWPEYYPGEKMGFMWRAKPHVMLGKCAEALALRKAFPQQLAGLYAQEEMEANATPPPPDPQKADPVANGYVSEADRRKIFQEATRVGVSIDDLKSYLLETHNVSSTAKLTPEIADDLMNFLKSVEGAQASA